MRDTHVYIIIFSLIEQIDAKQDTIRERKKEIKGNS